MCVCVKTQCLHIVHFLWSKTTHSAPVAGRPRCSVKFPMVPWPQRIGLMMVSWCSHGLVMVLSWFCDVFVMVYDGLWCFWPSHNGIEFHRVAISIYFPPYELIWQSSLSPEMEAKSCLDSDTYMFLHWCSTHLLQQVQLSRVLVKAPSFSRRRSGCRPCQYLNPCAKKIPFT